MASEFICIKIGIENSRGDPLFIAASCLESIGNNPISKSPTQKLRNAPQLPAGMHGRLVLQVYGEYWQLLKSLLKMLGVFLFFFKWNHTFLVSADPKRVKIILYLNKNSILGICGRIVDTDASKRSSVDPWRELWHGQDGWGARGKPRTPESEYSWAVRCARPRFLMMGKSQSCSICCQRWRRSRRQAVISDKAFLWKMPKNI